MELLEPKPKKSSRFKKHTPFAIKVPIEGRFNGFSVVISDPEDMYKLNQLGSYGKANLSRSFRPAKKETEIIRKRQFTRRKQLELPNKVVGKVLVVPDSDSENENYFTNLRPEYQIDNGAVQERLHLMLEEAFYLQNVKKCLLIASETDTWKLYCETDPHFVQNYIVYSYFRSKNWVVKPGLKFGGDFRKRLHCCFVNKYNVKWCFSSVQRRTRTLPRILSSCNRCAGL